MSAVTILGDTSGSVTLQAPTVAGTTTLTLPTTTGTVLADIASSLSASGYERLSNGLMIQWGTTGTLTFGNNATAVQSLTFPIAFPTTCLIITGSPTGAGAPTTSNGASATFYAFSYSTTGCSWQFLAPNNGNVTYTYSARWIAIGY